MAEPLGPELSQSVQQAVVGTDLDGRITSWNRFAEALFGWRRDEVIGRDRLEITNANPSDALRREIRERIMRGESWSREVWLRKRDGSLFTGSVIESPVSGADGNATGVLVTFGDVTERRTAREELMRREALLTEAQELALLGSWEVELATRTHSWSDETYHILGIEKKDRPPTLDDLLAVVHEDDRHALLEAAEWPLTQGVFPAIDLRITHPSGEERTVHLRGRTFGEVEGRARLTGFVQDVTLARKAQRELQRRSTQQAAVASISQTALRGTDVQTLFRLAATRVAEVLSVEIVDVLRRVAGRAMQFVASVGRESAAGRILLIDEGSSIAHALVTGETVLIEDTRTDSQFTPFPFDQEAGVRSSMIAAIFDAEWIPIGSIAVHNRRPTHFTEDETRFLQAIASVLAQALDRHRTDEELKSRAAQQIAIAEFGRKALAGVTPELLDHGCRILGDLLGMEIARFVQRTDNGTLRVAAGTPWLRGNGEIADSTRTQAGFTLRSLTPVIVADYASETRFDAKPFADAGIVSGISVAVCGEKRTFGVLAAHTRTPRIFSEGEVNFVEAVANVMAEALERDAARRALVESEEGYRAVVEGASEIIYTVDAEGRFTSLNHAFETITGWRRDEWIGRPFIEILSDSVHERASRLFGEILRGGIAESETELRTASGGTVTVHNSASALMVGGKVVRIHGFARDITATKAAESERSRLTRDMQLLLESTYEAICAFDLDGNCTLVNRAAALLLDISPSRLIGMHLHSLIHPESDDCPIERVLGGAGAQRVHEATFHRANGTHFPVEYGVAPIVDEGVTKGAVLTFTDVTDRRKLEAQLEQAHRLTSLGRLAATIAHEFNNVLMGISPFVELLRRGDQTFERRLTALEHIGKSVKRGKRISDEILRYTNPAEPVMEAVALKSWSESFAAETQSILGPKYDLVVELSDPTLQVVADAAQMHQIFTNLVLNARDAMPDGGPLRIAFSGGSAADLPAGVAGRPEEFVHVRIEDRGVGIPANVLRHIFEPLFTTKRTGTGLGLAVTHQVVKRHGGDLFVESTPGEGSTFHIFLPRAKMPEEQRDTQPAVPAQTKGLRRVLLVEDEPAVASGVALLLELEGIIVDIVDNGSAVLAAIETNQPDAVVLDIGLPDIDGTQVYAAIAARHPNLPVVFSTGHGDASQLESYLSNQHVGFLMKPYDIERLLESLQRVTSA